MPNIARPRHLQRADSGFSLPELLVSLLVLSVIVGVVTQLSMQMSNGQRTMWNRTQMHSSVRGAIALLQQEVGQAGLVVLPAPVTLSAAVSVFGNNTVAVSSTAGMFVGEKLVINTGASQETVVLTALTSTTISAYFATPHPAGTPVAALGGFAQGILPPNMTNGSTGTVLKLFGDVNDDGQMVYIEYTCSVVTGRLSRNMMAWNAPPPKPALTAANILLSNVVANPGGTPCFSYQTETVAPDTYVTAIAVTLSVQTQDIDPVTRQYQIETKTLLNVSPRNVFQTWQMASAQEVNRIQPIPPSILVLIQ